MRNFVHLIKYFDPSNSYLITLGLDYVSYKSLGRVKYPLSWKTMSTVNLETYLLNHFRFFLVKKSLSVAQQLCLIRPSLNKKRIYVMGDAHLLRRVKKSYFSYDIELELYK